MTTAKIRPATVLDAEALAELHARVWRATYADSVDAAWLDARLARYPEMWAELLAEDEAAPTWLAHRDGRAVGFARATAVGAGHVRPLELESIYLDVDEQGSGTADNLMQMALGDAPASLWVWDGQARARAFYRRHGFVEDGETGAFGPLPTVRMVR
ncbi:N-acetyltransferase family protein [Georgenia sp. Z1344]|uniref:GNAT family N-acetyltransferase n=1 Tax=Georgenia sp. Z1344 TaxID=3416706 RepID=UPI003CEC1F04